MPSRTSIADAGLLPDNYKTLNEEFYDRQPWSYFDRRLFHLARVAADASSSDARDETVAVGPVEIRQSRPAVTDGDPVGLDEQAYAATEAEVLLHHSCETLLRLIHAHAPIGGGALPEAPWLEMARVRTPADFKAWVRRAIADADADACEELVAAVFGPVIEEGSRSRVRRFLRRYAEHFLDANSYNAAKHGFALRGAGSRLTLKIAGEVGIDERGLTVSWLGIPDGGDPRWCTTTRWLSLEAAIGLIHIANRLIECIWIAARVRYLGETPVVFTPPDIDVLYDGVGVTDVVLVEVETPLRYEGVERTFSVRKRLPRSW